MIFFRGTREAIGHFWLKHLLKQQKREVRLKAIGQIKTAAIIFDASSESGYQQARAFAQHMSAHQTQVKAIGYIDGHKQQMPYIGDQTYRFVTLKDFSFFFLPKTHTLKELVVTPFDALFVLTAKSFFPLKAFTSLSAAHLKVGFTGIWEEAMDLTFDLPNHSSEELAKQIIYYLGQIKTV